MKLEIEVTESVYKKIQLARGRIGEPYATALIGAILVRWSDRVLAGGLGRLCLLSRLSAFALEIIAEGTVENHVGKMREVPNEDKKPEARDRKM
jgi:hypothetical protein